MNHRPFLLSRSFPYTRLEYLENVGWSRVFLPIYPQAGDVVEVESEMRYATVSVRQSELVADAPWFFWGIYDTHVWYAGCNATLYSNVGADTEWHHFKYVSLGAEAGLWLDGRKIIPFDQHPAVSFAAKGLELWSFVSDRRNSLNKKKWVRIRINGAMVMQLLPILDGRGTPALYDTVSKRLFYNSGEDELVPGPVISSPGCTPLEYIESTGVQNILIPLELMGASSVPLKVITDVQFLSSARTVVGISTHSTFYWGSTAGNGAYELGGGIQIAADTRQRQSITFIRQNDKATLMVNGATVERSRSGEAPPNHTYGVFHSAYEHQVISAGSVRLYDLQIHYGDMLSLWCIPVLDATRRPCLYDVLHRVFYYSVGEVELIAGPERETSTSD